MTKCRKVEVLGLIGLAIGLATTSGAARAADAVKGKQLFARCSACHATDDTTRRLGPPLGNVVGRPAGNVAGYAYSPAMKGSKLTWSMATLDKYLAAPRQFVPGNKMIFAGLDKPAERADLIAYLSTISRPAPTKRK